MILSAAYAAPKDILAESGLTVVNAVSFATHGEVASKLIIVTAIMGILTSWNGFIIGVTRVLYSMGRTKMLPLKFATLHPKYKTPYFATLFVGIITIFTPLLRGNSLGWFVDASGFGTVIAYFIVAFSFVILRIKQPNIERPFKLKNGLILGFIAMIVAVFFIILYLPIGASSLTGVEWIIVLVWFLVGMCFYLVSLRHKKEYKAIREKVMYGE